MCNNDQLADFLTRIRNATRAGHRFVDVKFSNMNQNLAKVLQDEKFIEHFLVKHEESIGTLRIFLRYIEGREPLIRGLCKISNPGRRKYVGYTEIPKVFNGLGISIISTSQGVLAGHEAKKRKVGGELLCYVW
ncbi:MAG: ribosomal protein [Chlamydiia bacterium]|nr:ribosomal protein [Chlamydiia bacterium]